MRKDLVFLIFFSIALSISSWGSTVYAQESVKQIKAPIREITKRTGRSRNTIRKVLRNKAPHQTNRKPKASILDEYRAFLKTRYLKTGLSAVRLLEDITAMGYGGSADTVRISK